VSEDEKLPGLGAEELGIPSFLRRADEATDAVIAAEAKQEAEEPTMAQLESVIRRLSEKQLELEERKHQLKAAAHKRIDAL
jgi:hypothetical protein